MVPTVYLVVLGVAMRKLLEVLATTRARAVRRLPRAARHRRRLAAKGTSPAESPSDDESLSDATSATARVPESAPARVVARTARRVHSCLSSRRSCRPLQPTTGRSRRSTPVVSETRRPGPASSSAYMASSWGWATGGGTRQRPKPAAPGRLSEGNVTRAAARRASTSPNA